MRTLCERRLRWADAGPAKPLCLPLPSPTHSQRPSAGEWRALNRQLRATELACVHASPLHCTRAAPRSAIHWSRAAPRSAVLCTRRRGAPALAEFATHQNPHQSVRSNRSRERAPYGSAGAVRSTCSGLYGSARAGCGFCAARLRCISEGCGWYECSDAIHSGAWLHRLAI